MDWLDGELTVENIPKPYPLKLPVTFHPLYIKQDRMNLFDLLNVASYWMRGEMECGYIIDEENGLKYPSIDEMEYSIQHGETIKLTKDISQTKLYWHKGNILLRRLHNICFHIDKEYFYNCIKDYQRYFRLIMIEYPVDVFISLIIDPDIFMTILKNSEIEAAKEINKKVGGIRALRPENETAIVLYDILGKKVEHLHKIYQKYGPTGFINMVRERTTTFGQPGVVINEFDKNYPHKDDVLASIGTIEEKLKYINNIPIQKSEYMSFVAKYLDMDYLPEQLKETAQYKDTQGNITEVRANIYYDTLKRVYTIFKQLEMYYPHCLESSNKWIISHPFYRNNKSFALYNKKANVFLVAFPDVTIKILDSVGALQAYAVSYGEDILLDGEEMSEVESKKAPCKIFADLIPENTIDEYKPVIANS